MEQLSIRQKLIGKIPLTEEEQARLETWKKDVYYGRDNDLSIRYKIHKGIPLSEKQETVSEAWRIDDRMIKVRRGTKIVKLDPDEWEKVGNRWVEKRNNEKVEGSSLV